MGPYSQSFLRAVGFILRDDIEGGYVNDPDDPGGETKFGISKRAHPTVDIKALTREGAVAIYFREYWSLIKGDALPPRVARCVFDCAVNQGVEHAKLLLQKTLGVKQDGDLGPITLSAARARPEDEVYEDFLAHRALRYAETKNFKKYGRGWFIRLFELCTDAAR